MRPKSFWPIAFLAIVCGLGGETRPAMATVFFDNLDADSGGLETADDEYWLAGLFTTDGNSYTSLTAILWLAQDTSGLAQLDLYTDEDGFVPSSYIASFASPTSYSTSSSKTTFSLTGISLSANTNYWLVLHAPTGTFDWAWSGAYDGDEDLQPWAISDDAGETWFGGDAFPFLYSVESGATTLAGDFDADGGVDGSDFLAWQRGYGTYDAGDLADWQTNYGVSSLAASLVSVPEPNMVSLLTACIVSALL